MSTRRNLFVGLATLRALAAATSLPCDLYAAGNTPCVAAHSTTRSLYADFNGRLYQVTRSSDSQTTDIYPLSKGGVANVATQESFCAGTSCVISIIYDQSPRGNDIPRSPGGHFPGPQPDGSDNAADAFAAPISLSGQKVYGVFVAPGTGYRNNTATGTATGDEPQGIYAVFDGTHYNDKCCFDYGNAETSGDDTGNAHMEALYFGNNTDSGSGAGDGPWIMADLENGLFSGYSNKVNTGDPTITDRFVTAVLKGTANQWALRGGNAASGDLSTFYDGQRPDGYNPMLKEGAIILGVGGDNSNGGQGTFYEGVMTSGYPSDSTEDAVQANIVSAGYAVSNYS